MTDDCVWLYAVLRGDPGIRIAPPGVDGETVRAVSDDDEHAALVGDVCRDRFGPGALERNLEQLDWLARVARAHDGVIRAARAHGTAIPMRMATLFQSDEAVRRMLAERRAEFAAVLESVAGRAEWGVKAYLDPRAWAKGEHAGADVRGPGEGSSYLKRRRAQLAARTDAENEAADWTRAAHARLREVCAASRVHRPQDPRLSGRADAMILNASYLVDDARAAEMRALAEELARGHDGLELQLTGPWPPYSFTTPPGARDE